MTLEQHKKYFCHCRKTAEQFIKQREDYWIAREKAYAERARKRRRMAKKRREGISRQDPILKFMKYVFGSRRSRTKARKRRKT